MENVISRDDISFFYKNGFLLIKDVFNCKDIIEIRNRFEEAQKNGIWKSAPYHTDTIMTDIYKFYPDFISVVFSKIHIQIAKDLLGDDCIMIPECAIHRNRYFDWLRDDINELGKDFCLQQDLSIIQTAIDRKSTRLNSSHL